MNTKTMFFILLCLGWVLATLIYIFKDDAEPMGGMTAATVLFFILEA